MSLGVANQQVPCFEVLMRYLQIGVIAAAVVAIAGANSRAGTLFAVSPRLGELPSFGLASNGPDHITEIHQQIAQPLVLAQASRADSLTWYGSATDGQLSPLPTQFVVQVLSDSSGLPGSVYTEQSVVAAPNPTGFLDYFDRPIASYTAQLAPFLLQPNVPYWLSILENDAATQNTWAWQGADLPPGPPDVSLFAARWLPTTRWFFSSFPLQSRAFTLEGIYVPEPSSLLLACAVIAALSMNGFRTEKSQ
jgi:hypothetical protein